MTFLEPAYLYGLLALAIPIFIHLFSLRKTKVIYFSNTALLQQINKKTAAKRNIKYYLILLSRLLFITALVLAFAQPVRYLGDNKKNEKKAVMFVLDNSMSMTSKNEDNITLFDEAISNINKMLEFFTDDTPLFLLTNKFNTTDYSNYDKETLHDKLTEIKLSAEGKSFNNIFNRINAVYKTNKLSGLNVFWISDFQKSIYNANNLEENIKNDSTITISLLPSISKTKKNVFIDSVYLDNPYVSGYEKTVINAIIRNSGNETALKTPVKLIINDVQIATVVSDIEANKRKKITFQVQTLNNNENPSQVLVEDQDIHFDNKFYFNLKKGIPSKICTIHGSNINGDNIDKVYAENPMFKYTAYTEKNIDFGQLQQADLIILNQINNFDDGLAEKINSIINTQLTRLFFIPNKNNSLPNKFFNLENNLIFKNDSTQYDVSIAYQKEMLFENVFEKENYDENTFLTYAKKVLDIKNYNHNILKFSDGTPLLAKYGIQHSIYILASPLDEEYTNFHLTSIFVPLMYKLATYQLKVNEPLYYNFKNKSILVPLDTVYSNAIYKLKRDNQEFITPQRIINNDLLIELSNQNINAGFYKLDKTDKILAFNTSKKESNILSYSIEELKKIFKTWKNVEIKQGNNNNDRINTIEATVKGQLFSKYFIIIALLCLFSEIILIKMWKS